MGMIKGWIALVAVIGAFAFGWAAAMVVNAGAPIADEEDAYVRFRNALAGDDSLERTETLVRLTKGLNAETLSGAVRAFEEDIYPRANSDIRVLMAYWAKHQPREMVKEVFTWNDLRVQQIAVTEALNAIAEQEPWEAVREFYESMPLHGRQTALVSYVRRFIDHADVADLPEFILSFADHEERDRAGEVAVNRMIQNFGPEALQEWIESLPDGRGNTSDLKVVAFRASARAHMDNGHQDEFEAWLHEIGDESWARGGWRSVAVIRAKTDPVAAIEWARGLPEGDYRLNVIQEAIRVFSLRDSDAAFAWILEQPPSLELDRGTGVLAIHYKSRDSDRALDLLERIVGPDTFANAVRTLTNYWKKMPPRRRDPILERVDQITQARLAKAEAGGDAAQNERDERAAGIASPAPSAG